MESTSAHLPTSTDAAGAASVLSDVHRRLCRIEQKLDMFAAIVAQSADPSHVSVEAAARVLGVSTKTIRRRIASGGLTLETIPGTRRTGIRTSDVYDGWWVPLALSQKLLDEERRELETLKRKSR